MTGRRLSSTLAIGYAFVLLLLALPQFPQVVRTYDWFAVWAFGLQAGVPALVYIVAGVRSFRDGPLRLPASLIEAAMLPYLGFLVLMIVACISDRDDSAAPRILAAAIFTVAALFMFLCFAEAQLAAPATAQSRRQRLRQWMRRVSGERLPSTLPVGAALLMVAMFVAKDSREVVTHGFRFVTTQEGVGSPAAWTQVIETALGMAFAAGAVLLTVAALVTTIRKRTFGRWMAVVSASLAAAAVADYYFGWLYAYSVGALSNGGGGKWERWWMVAATSLWLASVFAVPIATSVLRSRTPQARDAGRRFTLLIYTPMLLYVLVMLPLLSESLEARGESAALLALQLLAWHFNDRATAKETVEIAPLAKERHAMAS